MRNQPGQSLVELLIAMGIFVLSVSAITFLILDVYLADRAGRERMIATFLAKEGIEATRSIRDNNWSDLTPGDRGLTISGSNWIFQGEQEGIDDKLHQGVRTITIQDIDSDRKKITSRVSWQLTGARSQEVTLISYLTNWGKIGIPATCEEACLLTGFTGGNCKPPPACPDPNKLGSLGDYDCSSKKICCCE